MPSRKNKKFKINGYEDVFEVVADDFEYFKKVKEAFASMQFPTNSNSKEIKQYSKKMESVMFSILQKHIHYSDDDFENAFKLKIILKQIYEIVIELQNNYLNTEYPLADDYDLATLLEITNNLVKINGDKKNDESNTIQD